VLIVQETYYKIFYILWINISKKLFLTIYQKWIVRKRDDGRYIVRKPKIGVLVKKHYFQRIVKQKDRFL